jgi:hypothetical protein
MAIAPVLKTGVRKGLGVRIPHSPPIILPLAADPAAFIRDFPQCSLLQQR